MGRVVGKPFRVGCSGWQYRHWKGDFDPADLPQREWLEYYARQFDTVEVNNSFYRLPAEGVFDSWRARTPTAFLFAVKASRFLTHMKKLKDPREPVERLFSRALELRSKLGPVLYQLPKQMSKNVERLAEFLEVPPPRVKHAIEFREPGWYDDDVMRLLHRHNVALCLHDMPGAPAPRVVTARFTYVRFHGASGRYGGSYPVAMLENWAEWLADAKIPAFVYFNNDVGGHAPRDAKKLIGLLPTRQQVDGSRESRRESEESTGVGRVRPESGESTESEEPKESASRKKVGVRSGMPRARRGA